MSLTSYLVCCVIAYFAYIFYLHYVNVYPSVVNNPEKRYDYIIGAGTAGCVLAARLSEDPRTKVLVVEAGDHMNLFTNIPLTATAAQLGPYDWAVQTTPQRYSSFGLFNQTQRIPRGRGLGGSGQINFLMHNFGLAEDFQKWQELGFKSWGYEDLKPYFLKAFGTYKSEFDSSFCDFYEDCLIAKTPMKLTLIEDTDELMQTFKEASSRTSGRNILYRKPTATTMSGRRWSTFDAYLKPVLRRKNLHVLLKTKAVSIRFEIKMASSLYILQNGYKFNNIFANKEIIVAAGAIKTPQLLMLSGIGPERVLKKIKIKPVLVNENIGRNLHDNMNMPIYVSITKPISVTLAKIFTFGTLWAYLWHNKGMLAFPPLAGIEYNNNSALMLFAMGTTSERLLRELSNYKPKVFRDMFRYHDSSNKEGFVFLATCVKPASRGSVSIKDISVSTPPEVDPNYLHEYTDVKCMIKAIRRAERLVASIPFQDIGAVIHWPRPERCLTFWNTKYVKRKSRQKNTSPSKHLSPPDAYLECVVREAAVSGHHAGGTCSAGCVDEEFRLKSVSGLRIVDASVLPAPLSTYPNSVIVAMAEKASDIIRNLHNTN